MRIKDIIYAALMASFTVVLGLIPPILLPIVPVPITLQSLGVMLAGSILGAKRAFIALLLFLLLTAVGIPTLAGEQGGLAVFFMPSAGFLLAWPLGAWVVGKLTEYFWPKLNWLTAAFSNFMGGVIVLYLIGIPWLAWTAHITLAQAALSCLIFLPGDILKISIATWVALVMKRSYPLIK